MFQSVIPIVSFVPGSPLSVIVTCKVRFPPTSGRLAFDRKSATPKHVELGGPLHADPYANLER
jgi:hypothetical protein